MEKWRPKLANCWSGVEALGEPTISEESSRKESEYGRKLEEREREREKSKVRAEAIRYIMLGKLSKCSNYIIARWKERNESGIRNKL